MPIDPTKSKGYLNNNPFNVRPRQADLDPDQSKYGVSGRWQGVKTAYFAEHGGVIPVQRNGRPLIELPVESRFLVFNSFRMGARAGIGNHQTHYKRGDNTISKLLHTTTPISCRNISGGWADEDFRSGEAPDDACLEWENSPEDVANYIRFVSDWVGVGPDEHFNILDDADPTETVHWSIHH